MEFAFKADMTPNWIPIDTTNTTAKAPTFAVAGIPVANNSFTEYAGFLTKVPNLLSKDSPCTLSTVRT